MVRRTKAEAQETRHALLDAAERVFDRHGVAAASLQQVAAEAGLTRGAVYWHFRDKADLVNAMMERAIQPFEQRWFGGPAAAGSHTPACLRDTLCDMLTQVAHDERLRRVMAISTLKMEYVGEQDAIRAHHLQLRARALLHIEQMLQHIAAGRPLAGALPPKAAAHALHALLTGLISDWMLDRGAFDLCRVGRPALEQLIRGLTGDAAAFGDH